MDVERVVLIAALKPGAREQALDLLRRSADIEQERVTQGQLGPWLPFFEGPLHLARQTSFLERGSG